MSRIKYLREDEFSPAGKRAVDYSSQRIENHLLHVDVVCLNCGRRLTYKVAQLRRLGLSYTGLCARCNGRKAIGKIKKLLQKNEVDCSLWPYINFESQKVIKRNTSVEVACPRCQKKRWIAASQIRILSARFTGLCKRCSQRGEKESRYRNIYVSQDDPCYEWIKPMLGWNDRTMEHRLVMAKSLGHALESWEQVHHKNGDRKDNRIENLVLVNASTHSAISRAQYVIKQLREENASLRERIQELEAITD